MAIHKVYGTGDSAGQSAVADGASHTYDDGMPGTETLSTLNWLVEAGADEAIGNEPVDRFRTSPPPGDGLKNPAPKREDLRERAPDSVPKFPLRISPLPADTARKGPSPVATDNIGRAQELAKAATTLAELKAALEAFDGCALKKTATTTVFADGTPSHRIMLIGEAPGGEEDRQGLPFVGRAGQLLDRMLASIGLSRKTNAYITNVINWRPPGNRDPSPEEAAMCLPFLRRHIELVNPGILILLGAVSARHVMGNREGIMKLRGRWLEYYVNGQMIPVMPTLHPAYLLRQPSHKKLAWRDLQAIESKIESLGLRERTGAD